MRGDVPVWCRDARVNTRRCMEGLHHCVNVIVADFASGGGRGTCREGLFHCCFSADGAGEEDSATSDDRELMAVLLQTTLETLFDLESVCAHVKADMGFELVKFICEIHKCVQQGNYGIDDMTKARLKDYMRWIQASMTSLVANLDMNVPVTLSNQPLKSSARLDYHSLIDSARRLAPGDASKVWTLTRCKRMGGFDNFSPCISIFNVR